MTKLVLINSGRKIEFATTEPLNLECIASYVHKYGIDVKIIDELAGQNVRHEVLKYKPDIVGITGITPVILDAYRIADMCRSMGILTVLGGVHASVLPDEALEHADIVVVGEGEVAMLEIIQQGIKKGIVNGKPLHNLDDIPIFDKSGVEIDFYLRMPATYIACAKSNMKVGVLLTSRGCYGNCIFCHNSWRGLKYRANSIDRVMEEIKILINKYHVQALHIIDDNLFMNKPRIKEFCEKMIENKINLVWAACSRVNDVNEDILKLAYKAGCRQIMFGFETGSQRMLGILNKGTTVEQNAEAIRLCRQAGIISVGAFMIASPTETVEDVRMTQEFIKKNPIDSASAWITTPFPATQLWDWGIEHNLINPNPDWSKFVFTGINKGILVNDTMTVEEIETVFKETNALLNSTHNKIGIGWFAGMFFNHPVKSVTLLMRSSHSLPKYLYKVFLKERE